MRKKKSKAPIECRNGRYYESGRMLRKKDYIFHYSAHEQDYVLTNKEKYRLKEVRYV